MAFLVLAAAYAPSQKGGYVQYYFFPLAHTAQNFCCVFFFTFEKIHTNENQHPSDIYKMNSTDVHLKRNSGH